MKSWKTPTAETVDRALGSAKREIDRQFFFSRLNNPLWIQPLAERGCFTSPPNTLILPDGSVQFPFWPELQYLTNIAKCTPKPVVEILLTLPRVENPHVYIEILEIALELPGEHSSRLKDKMLEYARLEFQTMAHRYPSLLAHWAAEGETSAALELADLLIQFAPDPETDDKRKRYKNNPKDRTSHLNPSARFESQDYREILTSGVRPLAQREPYKTACMLIDATASMIYLSMHPEQLDEGRGGDASEGWCRRLSGPGDRSWDEREALAHTLTFACEQVYEIATDKVAALDERLRNQRWRIFKRLRQYLYALHPTEHTKPWIRDLILGHGHYGQSEYGYEFQLMVRRACQRFGTELLPKEELSRIFDTILSGPSKDSFKEWLGEEFTEEKFANRQKRFHRMQLRMFEPVLFGDYLGRFRQLEVLADEDISDDDYSLVGKAEGGVISSRSPRSPEELAAMGDQEVLAFINEWDAEHRDEENWLVEFTIEGLADAFQTFFIDSVIPNAVRLQFWIENRGEIKRPIYVRAIVDGMKDFIKSKDFERLGESLEFCGWVLSHPDQEREDDTGNGDKSKDNPFWGSSRQAVVDLIGTCIEKEVNVPYAYQEQLINLLDTICTQFDWRLDRSKPVLINGNDQLTEAINNTRSRALQCLIELGTWLQDWDTNADLRTVTSVLENRFSTETEYPLTLPERAILGANYARLLFLDRSWAAEHTSEFFPQDLLPAWQEAFGCFLRYSRPKKPAFEVLRDEYNFAVQHLADFSGQDGSDTEFPDYLGHHLLFYYLWDLYPLNGEESLLERFYLGTDNDRKRWEKLFEDIGIKLKNTGDSLDSELKQRLLDFFEWRLAAGNSRELGGFHWWLEAECLEAEWRLDSFSRVLDATEGSTSQAVSLIAKALEELLPGHTSKVVECFARLTDTPNDSIFYVGTETAKRIIRAGLDSGDEDAESNATRARENLLRKGYFDLLNLED